MKVLTKSFMAAAVIILTLAVALTGGCVYIGDGGITGNGQKATEEREIGTDLKGVVNRTSFDVVIDPQLEGKAVIEGESNLIKLVELNQDGEGVLAVELKPGTSIIGLRKMTVRIPAVKGGIIRTEGSGDITLKSGTLEGENFNIGISGSGDIKLALDTGKLGMSVNGSGDIDLEARADIVEVNIVGSGDTFMKGSAGQLNINTAGSGDFGGLDFAASGADVNLSGSGDVSVNVSGKLTGSIVGSGDVIYGGNPESVTLDDNGDGDVSPR